MDVLAGIFSAFGLSASAGLNAYIHLLVVALLARFTDLIHLQQPFDTLTNITAQCCASRNRKAWYRTPTTNQ